MAKEYILTQSTLEESVYPIDWTNSLLSGVTVSSVATTHTPPSGSAASITNTLADPISYIEVPAGLALGTHFIDCVATTSNAKLSPVVRLIITVKY
jgi:hypothetical protein